MQPRSLEYACKETIPLNSCKGKIFWNDELIYSLSVSDYAINSVSLKVLTEIGSNNTLRFEDDGIKDGAGLSIDNVKLLKNARSKNIVVNGDFELPQLGDRDYQHQNTIAGWNGFDIEIGYGKFYNSKWETMGNNQVCELDSSSSKHRKVFLEQSWTMDGEFNVVPVKSF